MALNKVKEIISSYPVVILSKTYCGYCRRVKQLLTPLGARYNVIELDEERDGDEIQSALASWTGQRTVPSVFIGGKHVGGCDKASKGEPVSLLVNVGAIENKFVQLQKS